MADCYIVLCCNMYRFSKQIYGGRKGSTTGLAAYSVIYAAAYYNQVAAKLGWKPPILNSGGHHLILYMVTTNFESWEPHLFTAHIMNNRHVNCQIQITSQYLVTCQIFFQRSNLQKIPLNV